MNADKASTRSSIPRHSRHEFAHGHSVVCAECMRDSNSTHYTCLTVHCAHCLVPWEFSNEWNVAVFDSLLIIAVLSHSNIRQHTVIHSSLL